MILLLEVLAVLAVVFGVAVVLTGRGEGLSVEGRDFADTGIPRDRAMMPADVVGLRFALAFRGYRMNEVDDALDRLAAEIAARDEAIAALRAPAAAPAPEPPAPTTEWPAATPAEPELPGWSEPVLAAPTAWEPPTEPAPENPFRPQVPDIPTYDPWSVTPRSRYTDGPEYVEVEHHDDEDVEALTEHQSGHAPAPPAEPPAEDDDKPTWPS